MCEFEKDDSKTFFHILLNNLLTKDLMTLGNLISTKFMNPKDDFINFRHASLGATRIEEQSVKPFDEPLNDKASPKTMRGDALPSHGVKPT